MSGEPLFCSLDKFDSGRAGFHQTARGREPFRPGPPQSSRSARASPTTPQLRLRGRARPGVLAAHLPSVGSPEAIDMLRGRGRQDLVEPQLEQLAEIDLLPVFDAWPILGGRGGPYPATHGEMCSAESVWQCSRSRTRLRSSSSGRPESHRAVPYEPSTQVRKVVGSRRNKARQHRSQAFIPNPETIRGAWRKTCLLVMTPRTMQACPRGCALVTLASRASSLPTAV